LCLLIEMSLIKNIKKYFTLVDGVFLGLGLIVILGIFLLFYRKNEYVTVRVKLTDTNPLYAWNYPRYSYSQQFKVGDTSKDGLGKSIAEIVAIDSFDFDRERQVVYLDLYLKATHDSRSKLYYFRGKPLVYGSEIDLTFSNTIFKGIVTEAAGSRMSDKNFEFVETQFIVRGVEEESIDKLPIEPQVIESLVKGRKIVNSKGDVMLEIIDSVITPALRIVETDTGNVFQRSDPFYKDAKLTLKVRVRKVDGKFYIFDDIPLRVGLRLDLPFDDADVTGIFVDIQK